MNNEALASLLPLPHLIRCWLLFTVIQLRVALLRVDLRGSIAHRALTTSKPAAGYLLTTQTT